MALKYKLQELCFASKSEASVRTCALLFYLLTLIKIL